jgi:hypothetical protein
MKIYASFLALCRRNGVLLPHNQLFQVPLYERRTFFVPYSFTTSLYFILKTILYSFTVRSVRIIRLLQICLFEFSLNTNRSVSISLI